MEYVLLMVVAVTLGALLMRGCVERKPGPEGGSIIQLWNQLLLAIGADKADEVKPQSGAPSP